MRISFKMTNGQVLDNLVANAERLTRAQGVASSGKRISRPSDDVTGASNAMRLRSSLSSIEQFGRNTAVAKSQMTVTSSALDSVVNAIQSARTLALSAANSAITDEARAGIAPQLDRIIDTLVAAGNTQFSGKYIFSGSATSTPPIAPSAGAAPYAYQGDGTEFKIQIAPGNSVAVNTTAETVFNMGGSAVPSAEDIFSNIKALRDEILSGDTQAISSRIEGLDVNLNNVIAVRSQMGGRLNRLESTNNMLLDLKLSMSNLLSETEDSDMA
ncbi:MAG: flagellar hook-associated protein FlgL [Armatimonadota bacterium]